MSKRNYFYTLGKARVKRYKGLKPQDPTYGIPTDPIKLERYLKRYEERLIGLDKA